MAEAFELAIEEAIPDVCELLEGIKSMLKEEGLGHLIIGGEEEEQGKETVTLDKVIKKTAKKER